MQAANPVGVMMPCTRALRPSSDVGSALVLVLWLAAAVAAVASMTLALSSAGTMSAALDRDGTEAFYAAEAMLEAAVDELSPLSDWSAVLAGTHRSRWLDGTPTPITALAGPLDFGAITAQLQLQSDTVSRWGPNNPRWRLYASGPLASLWPGAGPVGDIYVVAWVADDEAEGDNDPEADTNGTVRIRAESRARRGTRRVVEAVISKTGRPGVVRLTFWREAG